MRRFNLNGKYEFCPNGNYWLDISGIFDKKLYLFCDCNKCKGKVYELRPVNVTNKMRAGVIENARRLIELEELRNSIHLKNLDEIKQKLNDTIK